MNLLIIALLLSGGSAFGRVLSEETVTAYATSISDIFASASQEEVEERIKPVLSQIDPLHAQATVKGAKAVIRKYKSPINGSFIAGVIFALDTMNTQNHDVDAALASAGSAPVDTPPADTPIAHDDIDSTAPVTPVDIPNPPQASTAGATTTDAPAPIVPMVDSTASTPAGIGPQGILAAPMPHAPIDQNATLPAPPAVYPSAPQQLPADQKAAPLAPIDPQHAPAIHHVPAARS
jgi:hypothetical protein